MTKLYLGIVLDNIKQVSSFEQIMITLHTKFHSNRPTDFREEDFFCEGFLTHIVITAILAT